MARICVLVGHPRKATFCEGLAESYRKGAVAAGHHAQLFVLSNMHFDPTLHEGFERVQPLEPDMVEVRAAMLAADKIVLIFPLWMGMMPSILHGFIERIFQPDIVPIAKLGKFPRLLKGKSVLIVVTMGMPAVVYRVWFRSHILKLLSRNIFSPIGARPVRSLTIGRVEAIGDKGRRRWLKRMDERGRRAA